MAVTTTSENIPAKELRELPFTQIEINDSRLYLVTKRFIDILASVLGILLLSPLFIVISVLIKIEDKNGPVFFKQIRKGKNGEEFYMYKFRSMVSNAEELKNSLMTENEATGPVFKIREDPRVTKIGKLTRKTSIDELPQLLNVIKGDMSLVGPRPPLIEEVEQYTSYEKQRLLVTPGLTCYWQISGRSNIPFHEWVEMDIEYIQKRNLLLDLRLIFKTVFVLFGSKDAY